jgi:hypothetical protein
MGIFDIFSSKKRRADDDAANALAEMMQLMVSTNPDAADVDVLPNGHGPFGLSPTNPIPTNGILGSEAYLARLRTPDGQKPQFNRLGSTSAPEVTSGMIDIYKLSIGGKEITTIYICPSVVSG